MFPRLWAKYWPDSTGPESAYLPGHLSSVYHAAEVVLDVSGKDQLAALGLEPDQWFERFRRIVLAAAAVHDLGKANDHFQGMIRGTRRAAQALRHEGVTYLLLNLPEWKEWFRAAFPAPVEEDWRIALWAAAGHHPAYGRDSPPTHVPCGRGSEMILLAGHEDFQRATEWIASQLGLKAPPQSTDIRLALTRTSAQSALNRIRKAWIADMAAWDHFDEDTRKLVAAAKACLIGSDVAGSALPRRLNSTQAASWLSDTLTSTPDPQDLQAVVYDRLQGRPARPFQTAVTNCPSRVCLLRAGCGSGKTIAAYLWAATRCAGRRIYLCYPTTGTATEGFRDYLFDPDQLHAKYGARLFHSRVEVDLDMLLHARDDSETDEERLRIDSLLSWSTPVVCCTVDTVLGLVQNQRRGLYAWPALAQSAFVFDEIHAYDQRLFGALLRFLGAMRGVPVLLMTASLSKHQRQAIEQCLAKYNEKFVEIQGPGDLEALKRYCRLDTTEPEVEVRRELRRGGKVLWVCNTVDRAIETAERLADCSPLIYHSRFRYEDRVARHADVIQRFRDTRPALAVCTQVAEMSLDLSATLLVTELAPVPAMIQRLGRLNRRAVPPGPGEPAPPAKPFIVIEPRTPAGEAARAWLERLGFEPVGQRDLAVAWEQLQEQLQKARAETQPHPISSTWLDGGPRTTVDAVREPGHGITVIISGTDAEDVEAGRKPAARVALPMPPPPEGSWQSWQRIQGLLVAPADTIHYDPKRGARWRKENPDPVGKTP